MSLNEKILYCRKKAGLSQEALAEQLGVSRQAVSKWETGDAVPEIGKLLLLAKTFDVTTDWLLSEEEAIEYEKTNDYNDCYNEPLHQERYSYSDDWIDRIPGVLGKLVRKFGWLAGVYMAVVGGLFTGIGLIAKFITNRMMSVFNSSVNQASNMFGGFGGSSVTFYDSEGNVLGAEESAELMDIFGESSVLGYGDFNMSGIVQNNPVSIFAGILIVVGLVLLIAGIILAIVWKKRADEQK